MSAGTPHSVDSGANQTGDSTVADVAAQKAILKELRGEWRSGNPRTELGKLRALAEFWDDGHRMSGNAFHRAFDPPTVLALIRRVEAAEAKVARIEALAHSWAEDDQKDPAYALWLLAALGTANAEANTTPAPTGPEEGR